MSELVSTIVESTALETSEVEERVENLKEFGQSEEDILGHFEVSTGANSTDTFEDAIDEARENIEEHVKQGVGPKTVIRSDDYDFEDVFFSQTVFVAGVKNDVEHGAISQKVALRDETGKELWATYWTDAAASVGHVFEQGEVVRMDGLVTDAYVTDDGDIRWSLNIQSNVDIDLSATMDLEESVEERGVVSRLYEDTSGLREYEDEDGEKAWRFQGKGVLELQGDENMEFVLAEECVEDVLGVTVEEAVEQVQEAAAEGGMEAADEERERFASELHESLLGQVVEMEGVQHLAYDSPRIDAIEQ